MTFILLLTWIFSINPAYCMTKSKDLSYENTMKAINDYSSEIKKERGITLTRYGLHYAGPDKIYDGKIHQMSLGYRIDKNMKFDEARVYFYGVVNGLLDHLNRNEKLKEYFHHYPIGYEDLHFSLSFDYENKGFLKKEEINSIYIEFNKIYYTIVDVEGSSQPILESRAPDFLLMKGYTKEPRCIIRKLPESPDLTDGNASKNTTETNQELQE